MTRKNKILLTALPALALGSTCIVPLAGCTTYHSFNAKMVGHRGCPSNPDVFENTVGSFTKAGESSYYSGIECDVYPNVNAGTPDKPEIYVVHDEYPFYDSAKSVMDVTKDEAQNLSLKPSANYPRDNPGLFAHNYIERGYKIPTLEQYLNVCKEYNKIPVIEIKDAGNWYDAYDQNTMSKTHSVYWNDVAVKTLGNIVGSYQLENFYLISFNNELLSQIANTQDYYKLFDPSAESSKDFKLKHVQQLFDPSLITYVDEHKEGEGEEYQHPTGWQQTIRNWADWTWMADNDWNIDIGDVDSPSTADWGLGITKYMVDYFHEKKLVFNVWTVDTLDRAQALDKLGVDFITTDYIL